MLCIHMWMTLVRLRKEGKTGKSLTQLIYDNFQEDVEHRVRAAGVKVFMLISCSCFAREMDHSKACTIHQTNPPSWQRAKESGEQGHSGLAVILTQGMPDLWRALPEGAADGMSKSMKAFVEYPSKFWHFCCSLDFLCCRSG